MQLNTPKVFQYNYTYMMHQITLLVPGRYRRVHPSSCTSDVGSAWSLWSWSLPHGHPIFREIHHGSQWPPLGDSTEQHFKILNLIIEFIKDISIPKVYIEAYFTLCILPLQ